MANDVQVEVGLDAATFQKEMDKLAKSVDKLGSQIEGTMNTKVTKPFDIFKGTLGALSADRALSVITEQFKKLGDAIAESIGVAERKQSALQKLEFTLTSTKRGAGDATKNFSDFADELEKTTRFTDDQVLASVKLLAATSNLSNQGIKQAVRASADLASVLEVDLTEATNVLIKAEQGHLDRLVKMKLGVEEAGNAQATYARVLEKLASFQGQASAALNTYSGQIDQNAKAFENIQEAIGNIFIKNGAVIGFLAALKEKLDETEASTISSSSALSENLSDAIQFTIAFAQACTDTADVIGRAFRIIYDVIVGTVVALPNIIAKVLVAVADTTTGFVGIFNEELADKMKASYENFKNDTESTGTFVIDKFKDIGAALTEQTYLSRFSSTLEDLGTKSAEYSSRRIRLTEAEVQAFMDAEDEQVRVKRKASDEKLEKEGKLQADITALVLQAQAERDNAIAQNSISTLDNTDELTKKQLELDATLNFELQKNAIVFEQEMAKTKFIKDEDERRLAQKKVNAEFEDKQNKAIAKRDIDAEKNLSDQKKKIKEGELQATANFLQAGIMLAEEGSAVQKGLMITQAIVNTYAGATRAFEDYPFPASAAVAASVVALGLANVAKIAGAKFETGGYLDGSGIVGGSAITGDKVNVAVNSREMILTTQQQAELFRIANGGGNDNKNGYDIVAIIEAIRSTPIVVQANGREIARLVREESRSGFSFS